MNLASIAIRGSSGLQPEVETFISASYANITDAGIITDLNNLVTSLKNNGLWTLQKAVYPIVGGNANAHSYNLKDVTQYQITWSGGLTHDANGVTGNGTTGYGNTGIVPSTVLSLNSTQISTYIRVNNSGGSVQTNIGCNDASNTNNLYVKVWGGTQYTIATNSAESTTNASMTGWFTANRTGSSGSACNWSRNGSIIVNGPGVSTGRSAQNLTLLARNNAGSMTEYSASNYAFFAIGSGLNSIQLANFYTAIQAFQTGRGRQV